jgi:hypothetical protein
MSWIIAMGRTLSEMIDALPKGRRARIDVRYRELKDDVESLQALRKVAGKAQAPRRPAARSSPARTSRKRVAGTA